VSEGSAHRRPAIALLILGAVFLALTFLAAFTIYGEVAGLLAVGCLAAGILLLTRR
jgi:hypothetical protein